MTSNWVCFPGHISVGPPKLFRHFHKNRALQPHTCQMVFCITLVAGWRTVGELLQYEIIQKLSETSGPNRSIPRRSRCLKRWRLLTPRAEVPSFWGDWWRFFFPDFRVAKHSKWTTPLETILWSKSIWHNRNKGRDVSVLWMVKSPWPFRVNPQEDFLGLPGLSGHHGLRGLCFQSRKSAWLDGFAGAAHERWSIAAEGPQQHSGPGGAKDGIGGASIKTRGKACFIPWQCQVDSPSDPARARHCGRRCNLVLHLMPHRLVCCIHAHPDEEFGLEGVTQMESLPMASLKRSNNYLESFERPDRLRLPRTLQSLTFGRTFDQSLDRVSLPSSLQNLTFGSMFNQSLDRVSLPSSLQSLTLGRSFDQSLDGVSFPSSLQSLTFGASFNQSLDRVSLPIACKLSSKLDIWFFV